jgi:hypothetical protein
MKKDSMKKAKRTKATDLRSGYKKDDFPKGFVRGKYAARVTVESNIVRLDPEIHAAFPTSKAVNEALAGLLRVAQSARQTKRSSGNAKARPAER